MDSFQTCRSVVPWSRCHQAPLRPPGASSEVRSEGIVANARSRIFGNTVTGMQIGIPIYNDFPSPVSLPSRWSRTERNVILTRDSANHQESTTYGIQAFANDHSIIENLIVTPNTFKTGGIVTRGENTWIEGNTVISMSPADNGCTSPIRAIAFGVVNTSSNATMLKIQAMVLMLAWVPLMRTRRFPIG